MIAGEVAFLQNRANLAFGNAPAPPVTRPSTSLQNQQTTGNAAALAFNLANAGATANLASTGSVTAGGGTLSVIATSDIDSNAFATATTVDNLGGLAAAIAFNAQTMNNIAAIAGAVTAHQIVVRTDNSGDGIYTLHADSVSGAEQPSPV